MSLHRNPVLWVFFRYEVHSASVSRPCGEHSDGNYGMPTIMPLLSAKRACRNCPKDPMSGTSRVILVAWRIRMTGFAYCTWEQKACKLVFFSTKSWHSYITSPHPQRHRSNEVFSMEIKTLPYFSSTPTSIGQAKDLSLSLVHYAKI